MASGTAQTDKFTLGAATVMVGPMANLFNFIPATHSLGLVKNFTVSAEATYVELRQGVQNTLVYSVLNGNNVRASCEVYEYSAKNLNYALGLDGSTVTDFVTETTTTAALDGDPAPTATVPVASVTGLAALDYIMIQETATSDKAIVRQIASIAALNLTVTPTVGIDMATAAIVKKMNMIRVGILSEQPFLAVKIVGELANGEECILLVPKMRISRGFTMGFSVNDFGNLPFEFMVHDMLSTDPNATFFTGQRAMLFV